MKRFIPDACLSRVSVATALSPANFILWEGGKILSPLEQVLTEDMFVTDTREVGLDL